MNVRSNEFGEELRRRRLAAGLTLATLAERVHYSKAQLSKVERGLKRPSRELSRLCDTALDADGRLSVLWREAPRRRTVSGPVESEEVWPMDMSRRQAVGAGTVSLAGIPLGGSVPLERSGDTTVLGVLRSLFEGYRKLGQSVEPGLILPSLIAQTRAIRDLGRREAPRTRRDLFKLGSRYAEYTGWLFQESGDEQRALSWTQHAVALATEGEDHDLAAYALVRRALITLYREDAAQTIELARAARTASAPPRIRGLAAQREAQGHALAGDPTACFRGLEEAADLLAHADPKSGAPVIGTTNLTDPVEMIKGWCLYDLGRPEAAAVVIGGQLAKVPVHATRTRIRYGVRHALAHAAAGEIDHACELARPLLYSAPSVGSATIATDLRRLAHLLSRHRRNPSVRDLAPDLGTVLRSPLHEKGLP